MHTYVDVDRVEAGVIVFMRIQHGLPMLKKVLIMVHFSLSLSLSLGWWDLGYGRRAESLHVDAAFNKTTPCGFRSDGQSDTS